MHNCASILGSKSKETSCFYDFSHSASLHHYSFSWLVPHVFCFTYKLAHMRVCTYTI